MAVTVANPEQKTHFSFLLKHNNGLEFMSLLRSSGAARKLRRLVHRPAHAWRHWLPNTAAPTADSWRRQWSQRQLRLFSDTPEKQQAHNSYHSKNVSKANIYAALLALPATHIVMLLLIDLCHKPVTAVLGPPKHSLLSVRMTLCY